MDNNFHFLLYEAANEKISVNAVIKDETIWMTQRAMAELFDVEILAISKHLSNIFTEGELLEEATVSKMERQVKQRVDFYNLDAIISVGYRVNPRKATDFHIWKQATDIFAECSVEENLKKSMEQTCAEMGMSMTTAFTIFAKKVVRERRIPFEVSADPFYSESNMAHLRRGIESLNAGRGVEHDIAEEEGG